MTQSSSSAKFIGVRETLRREIANKLRPGAMLPSEQELAARFDVNRHTVRRAMQDLVDEGLIARHAGQGSWVLGPPLLHSIAATTSFSQSLMASGSVPSSEVLSAKVVKTPAWVSNRFEVRKGLRLVELEMLRRADGIPLVASTHWLPAARVPRLESVFKSGSLHQALVQHFGIQVQRHQTVISTELAGDRRAELLETSPRHPVLVTQSVNTDSETGQPIEYVVSAFKGSAVQLVLDPEQHAGRSGSVATATNRKPQQTK